MQEGKPFYEVLPCVLSLDPLQLLQGQRNPPINLGPEPCTLQTASKSLESTFGVQGGVPRWGEGPGLK